MKHIPILFSTTMVQSILDGRKTQTRRTLKHNSTALEWLDAGFTPDYICSEGNEVIRPYNVGDVLWVREKWCPITPSNFNRNAKYLYASNVAVNKLTDYNWKPSIHMPKEACRIWLKVKAVRVEQLHDISDADILAEGVQILPNTEGHTYDGKSALFWAFRLLWMKINGFESWEANPWVWVIEFERCEMPDNFLTPPR